MNRFNTYYCIAMALPACFTASPLGQTHADQFEEAKPNNWHHWRGPDANGVSTTAKPPVQWSPTNNIQWKVPVEGNGSSTPIIWGNKLFVLTAINTGEVDPTLPKPEDQPKPNIDPKYNLGTLTPENSRLREIDLIEFRGSKKETK